MRIIFAGTPETAVPSLTALIESEHEVIAVLTRPDAKSGRGRTTSPSPVAEAAAQHGIPVLKYANLRDSEVRGVLTELEPDAIAVVAYGALVPSYLLALPKHGWINLHFSLLPAWRGAAPVPYAIKAGDEISGATTFLIDDGLDTGPIYGVITESIRQNDTAGTLLSRLAISGARLLVETLNGIESGRLRALPQINENVSVAPKISPAECQIDWRQPALAIERAVRAYTPEPGAWTLYGDSRIEIGPVTILETPLGDQPGEVIVTKHDVFVSTGSTAIRLGMVRPAGKKEMSAADWARGVRIDKDAVLSSSGK